MKKIINVLVRVAMMALVFAITVYLVNIFQNRNRKNLSVEMKEAELPLAYVGFGDTLLNCMHGYTGDVDLTLLRDSITPIDENKNIEICVEKSDKYGMTYSYEIRSIAGSSLIEKGEPILDTSGEDYDVLNISVRMDLKADMEYMLVVNAEGQGGNKVSYYTRIVVNDDYHEAEILEAVKKFHEATFEFDALESDSVVGQGRMEYMGSGVQEDFGLGHVNLASSYTELLWDGLQPTVAGPVNIFIKEIDVNYAVVELLYKARSTTSQDVVSGYQVKEFYKVCYKEVPKEEDDDDTDAYGQEADEEREPVLVPKISIISFDRYVDEYFDRKGIDALNNVYEIGIASTEDLEYRYSSDNKKIAFVRNGQLWLYDYAESDITLVYSFWKDDYTDEKTTYDNHDINIISLEDNGDITFAVYGYMNRGLHEGKLGIGLHTFDYAQLETEELLFAQCDVPFEAMKNETKRLTYYDGRNFYYMLGDKVNCIDVKKKKQSYIADNLTSRDVKVSDNMEVLAYGESDVQSENSKLTIMNMETGKNYEITAKRGQCLTCYGFKDSDMVYGIADKSDEKLTTDVKSFKNTRYSSEKRTSIPSSKLCIVNSNGELVKEYEKPGYYLMQVDVETKLLYLTRCEKNSNEWTAVNDDFITFKKDDENPTVQTVRSESYSGYNRLYFTVPSNIYLSYIPQLSITKQQVNKKATNMILTMVRDKVTYHVYGKLGLEKIYDVAGNAINYALDTDGIVVSSEGEVVYRNFESLEYNTIAARIFHHSSKSVNKSLSDCIYMVLEYQGAMANEADISQFDNAVHALNELGTKQAIDITGLSLDMVLGYVSKEIPVISRIDDGRYVLVVSYNDIDVRYYDPVEDKEIVVSREEYIDMMNACESELYAYIDE